MQQGLLDDGEEGQVEDLARLQAGHHQPGGDGDLTDQLS